MTIEWIGEELSDELTKVGIVGNTAEDVAAEPPTVAEAKGIADAPVCAAIAFDFLRHIKIGGEKDAAWSLVNERDTGERLVDSGAIIVDIRDFIVALSWLRP